MACPFFMPTRKSESALWMHPARLPLGAGWEGGCTAPGHEQPDLSADELREFCNMGYAAACSRLPAARPWDAVRFSVARESDSQVTVCYVCEINHRPANHGTLEYNLQQESWETLHPDPRIQKMADCYLHAYLLRKGGPNPVSEISS